MHQYQEVALGWAMMVQMCQSLNLYIGLVFPFGMGHRTAKHIPPLHIGMLMILATKAPLPKAWLSKVGKASNVSSS
jgi:hypothetical protein